MTESRLLVVLVHTERRDDMIDALIGREEISGFTLVPALGFSRDHSRFSVTEQVVGYRDIDRFEILIDDNALDSLLALLGDKAGNDPLRYWLVGLDTAGHLPPT